MTEPIYLIGYPGAGKSTVGRLLADLIGWHFVDLDDAFAEINGMTVGEFITRYGIEAFRRREKDCVEQLSELPIQNVVYATGGGYPCWEDNMECLLELGTTIYLKWDSAALARRIELSGTDNRPILRGKHGKELQEFIDYQMSAREEFYSKAHHTINAPLDGTIHEANDADIAQLIAKMHREHQLNRN